MKKRLIVNESSFKKLFEAAGTDNIEQIANSCGFYVDSANEEQVVLSNESIHAVLKSDNGSFYLSEFSGKFYTADEAHAQDLNNLLKLFNSLL